jgi:hypothetical protein
MAPTWAPALGEKRRGFLLEAAFLKRLDAQMLAPLKFFIEQPLFNSFQRRKFLPLISLIDSKHPC